MKIDPLSVSAILIALIGLVSGALSQRTASRASMSNSRTQAEMEAFSRARKMDNDTMSRQDSEILDLKEHIEELKAENKRLRDRIDVLERGRRGRQQGI